MGEEIKNGYQPSERCDKDGNIIEIPIVPPTGSPSMQPEMISIEFTADERDKIAKYQKILGVGSLRSAIRMWKSAI